VVKGDIRNFKSPPEIVVQGELFADALLFLAKNAAT
jgi:hypothetical protein